MVGNYGSQPPSFTAVQSFMPDFPIQPPKPLAFIADTMLGRLARWLRILGYDTAYDKIISDEALIERALREDRWLLTRDGYLAQRKVLRGRHTLLTSDDLEGQLRQLRQGRKIEIHVNDQRGYRCADCNTILSSILPEQAAPFVPSFVARQYREFHRCPRCSRIYWPGTHWDDVVRRLAAIREGLR